MGTLSDDERAALWELYNTCRDVIGQHYGEYWRDNGKDNMALLVEAMDTMDLTFGLRCGQSVEAYSGR